MSIYFSGFFYFFSVLKILMDNERIRAIGKRIREIRLDFPYLLIEVNVNPLTAKKIILKLKKMLK